MDRFVKISILILSLIGIGCSSVPPGHVGIRINAYGSQKGVEDFPVQTGMVWYNPWTEDIQIFPTYLQNIVWTKDKNEGSPIDESITFNSSEGAMINADFNLSYTIEAEKVPHIFVEFRQTAEHISHNYMRSQVRDVINKVASHYKATEIFGDKKQKLLDEIRNELNSKLGPKGFKIDTCAFVGGLRADERVVSSINSVIEQTQKALEAENKVRQIEAESLQKVAEAEGKAQAILKIAEAEAKSNDVITKSITPQLMTYKAIEKWNGITPQFMGGGNNQMPIPFVNLNNIKEK